MKARTQSIWFLVVFVAAMAVAPLLFIGPANRKRQALQRDMAEKKSALDNLERTAQSIRNMHAKLSSLQSAVRKYDSRLDSGQDLDRALEEIWRLSQANGLESKSVRTPAEHRSADLREQEIDLSLTGSFDGFYPFLLQLQDLPQIARIKKLYLTKINAREGEIQAELTLSVYFAPGSN